MLRFKFGLIFTFLSLIPALIFIHFLAKSETKARQQKIKIEAKPKPNLDHNTYTDMSTSCKHYEF